MRPGRAFTQVVPSINVTCAIVCVGGWILYGLSQIPSMLREYGWSKSDDGESSPSPSPRAADAKTSESENVNDVLHREFGGNPSDEQD